MCLLCRRRRSLDRLALTSATLALDAPPTSPPDEHYVRQEHGMRKTRRARCREEPAPRYGDE